MDKGLHTCAQHNLRLSLFHQPSCWAAVHGMCNDMRGEVFRCSDKDAANLMDIMQRLDLGDDIAGSAADQLINLVSSGIVPALLTHPGFLEHLVAQAGQLADCSSSSSPNQHQALPAASRLPKSALQLLAQIVQSSPAAVSFLASDLMRWGEQPA